MRSRNRIFLVSALMAVMIPPVPATASPYDTEVLVTTYSASTTFTWEKILSSLPGEGWGGPPPPIVVGPVHGELASGLNGILEYTPDSSFWVLGTDSFTYHVTTLESPGWITVTLQASDQGDFSNTDETFEGPVGDLSGGAVVTQDAALAGFKGLRATTANGQEIPAVYSFSHDYSIIGPPAGGGTEELKLIPPPPPPPPGPFGIGSGLPIVIYTVAGPGLGRAADILLSPTEETWKISARLYHDGALYTTPAHELDEGEHQLALDWWNASLEEGGGLALRVDGEMAGTITEIANWVVDTGRQVGVMLDPMATSGASIDVDDIRLSSTEKARAAFAPILRDSFEDGLLPWQTAAATHVDVTMGAALIGSWGLQVEPAVGSVSALVDPSPAAETNFGLRMRLSTDGLFVPPGNMFEILALSSRNDERPEGDQARLKLRSDLQGFTLVAEALSGDIWRSTTLANLSAGINTVELRWQAADDQDTNGWMEFWIDGTPSGRLDGLVNGGFAIESVRLGAWNVATETQGVFYVDGYETWSSVPRKPAGTF